MEILGAVASAVAVLAFVGGLVIWFIRGRQRQREQAEQISAWLENLTATPDGRYGVRMSMRNASNRPARDAFIFYGGGKTLYDRVYVEFPIGELPPGVTRTVIVPSLGMTYIDGLQFMDADRRVWLREQTSMKLHLLSVKGRKVGKGNGDYDDGGLPPRFR